jgi:hypothetical protein
MFDQQMILILVIAFFLLGCNFSCDGLKENFSTDAGCEKCINNLIFPGGILCGSPDNNSRKNYIRYMCTNACNHLDEGVNLSTNEINSKLDYIETQCQNR